MSTNRFRSNSSAQPVTSTSDTTRTSYTATDANASRKSGPTIGELFATLSAQLTTLVRGEIELTKTKATAFLGKIGMGGGLLAGGAVFALFMLGWIFHTIELGIAQALPRWAASLIVVGILLIIVLILALVGVSALKKAKEDTPAPQEGLKDDVDALKKGLGK